MIDIVSGDLFDAEEKYLCHQCNCVTNRAAHLARAVFERYPHADIYSGRVEHDKPGRIIVRGNGQDQRYIVNMLGQYYPGKPRYPLSGLDGAAIRERYFHQCLLRIAQIKELKSVAFPWKIGCGSAGGVWEHYLATLTNFAHYVEQEQDAKVKIYRLEE
jgi:hypothetical protein